MKNVRVGGRSPPTHTISFALLCFWHTLAAPRDNCTRDASWTLPKVQCASHLRKSLQEVLSPSGGPKKIRIFTFSGDPRPKMGPNRRSPTTRAQVRGHIRTLRIFALGRWIPMFLCVRAPNFRRNPGSQENSIPNPPP